MGCNILLSAHTLTSVLLCFIFMPLPKYLLPIQKYPVNPLNTHRCPPSYLNSPFLFINILLIPSPVSSVLLCFMPLSKYHHHMQKYPANPLTTYRCPPFY